MSGQPALEVLLVAFRAGRKGCFRNNGPLPVDNGALVILEVDRGIDMGRVLAKLPPDEENLGQCVGGYLREATPEDRERAAENEGFQREVLRYCRERIESRKLDMELTACEAQLDRNRIRIYFTADQRTDFRGLVRDLAANYRARIEMRQIGIRDDARYKGGLGICGRELCCSSFLDDFQSVTLKMVRTQNLSLNPSKVSGTCGRLMCCLAYEADFYQKARKDYPQPGQTVKIAGAPREVTAVDIFHGTVMVREEGASEAETLTIEEFNLRKAMKEPAPPPQPASAAPKAAPEASEGSRKRRRRRRKPAGADRERNR